MDTKKFIKLERIKGTLARNKETLSEVLELQELKIPNFIVRNENDTILCYINNLGIFKDKSYGIIAFNATLPKHDTIIKFRGDISDTLFNIEVASISKEDYKPFINAKEFNLGYRGNMNHYNNSEIVRINSATVMDIAHYKRYFMYDAIKRKPQV